MYLDWTKHLSDPKAKSEFEATVKSCRPALERLTQLIEEKEKSFDRSEMDIDNYDNPNWEFRQAHKNGYRAGLNYIKMLVDLDKNIIRINSDR
jgi:hypothetical protein